MKRRTFIRIVGASALGLPFLSSHLGSASWKAKPLSRARTPLKLGFSPAEAGVLGVLERHAPSAYLLGGGVLAKAAGADLPYLNLLVNSREFDQVKNELFAFGVKPISTPELPASYIRFEYSGQAYSVMNMELDAYLKQNALGQTIQLLPLAHNFLVFSSAERWVLDPYEAFKGTAAEQGGYRMKLAHEPDSRIMGLEVALAIAFDQVLLGLQPPARHAAFEKRLLGVRIEEAKEASVIVHHLLNYFPDLMELHGLEVTRKYLVSPLFLSAAAVGPGIDLRKVDASLRAVSRSGKEVTSAHLVSAINQQFCKTAKVSLFGTGIPDYMAANKMPVRRKDLLAQVLSDPKPVVEG